MKTKFSGWMRVALVAIAVSLAGCAGFGGDNLRPGESTLPVVLASMGEPAMRWDDPDGRVQLAYPHGPWGTQTFMVFIAPDGRLEQIDEVLNKKHFARIVHGKSSKEDVLRILGPSPTQWTMYFEARDELVWEWRFNDAAETERFNVAFDATTGIVRSTFILEEDRGERRRTFMWLKSH